MKLVEALLDGRQLDLARAALRIRGVSGFTITFVVALAAAGVALDGETRVRRFEERARIKIEVVAHDDLVGRVVEALSRGLRSGSSGGEIHVFAVEQAVRIRTDEIDEAAIS